MLDLIFVSLVLYVAHLMLPAILAILRKEATNTYLVGPRDEEASFSNIVKRAKRASGNIQESLLIFLPLAVLATINGAQANEAAAVWIGLRVVYLITYLMGLAYVRTLVWFASLVCLYFMGAALV